MLNVPIGPRSLGGMCRDHLLDLIVVAGFVLAAASAPPEALAQTIDPQLLVGKWDGTWEWTTTPDFRGEYNVTVTKVEGNQVFGRVDRTGGGKMVTTMSFDFVGTLEGDKLVFTGSGNSAEVMIYRTSYGTIMKGSSFENTKINISMTKNK